MSVSELSNPSEQLLPGVYSQLRRLAAARLAGRSAGQTLQPTALVHEAWLRLSSSGQRTWRGSSHFCAAAVETMRHILIDRARQRSRQKRWGDQTRVAMSEAEEVAVGDDEKTLLINEALERMNASHPQLARLVALKFFGGFSNQEIGQEMALPERTVERQWSYARAWLYQQIRPNL